MSKDCISYVILSDTSQSPCLKEKVEGVKRGLNSELDSLAWLSLYSDPVQHTHIAAHDAIVEDTDMFPTGF